MRREERQPRAAEVEEVRPGRSRAVDLEETRHGVRQVRGQRRRTAAASPARSSHGADPAAATAMAPRGHPPLPPWIRKPWRADPQAMEGAVDVPSRTDHGRRLRRAGHASRRRMEEGGYGPASPREEGKGGGPRRPWTPSVLRSRSAPAGSGGRRRSSRRPGRRLHSRPPGRGRPLRPALFANRSSARRRASTAVARAACVHGVGERQWQAGGSR